MVVLSVLIAGFGVFGTNINFANANPPITNLPQDNTTIVQLQQTIESLKQQIQQLIELISQLKPLETCGNKICRFGETAASCPVDCGAASVCGNGKCETGETAVNCSQDCSVSAIPACRGEGNELFSNSNAECCAGLQLNRVERIGLSPIFICAKCGDGICRSSETAANCPQDCANQLCGNGICENAEATSLSCPRDCDIADQNGNISGCGNGQCDSGKTAINCPIDCGGSCAVAGDMPWRNNQKTTCCAGSKEITDYRWMASSKTCKLGDSVTGTICSNCGNKICESWESACNCPEDCGAANCTEAGKKIGYYSSGCCAGLETRIITIPGDPIISEAYCDKCGNGICEKGETVTNCSADCD